MLNHGLKRETTLSHLFQKIASKRIRIAEAERFVRVAVGAGHGRSGTPKQQQQFGKRRTWGIKNHHFSWQSLCRKRSIASSTSYPRPHQLEKRRGPNGKGFVLLCEDYFFKNVGMNIISACRILPFTLWCSLGICLSLNDGKSKGLASIKNIPNNNDDNCSDAKSGRTSMLTWVATRVTLHYHTWAHISPRRHRRL